jgi:hypothetical protein
MLYLAATAQCTVYTILPYGEKYICITLIKSFKLKKEQRGAVIMEASFATNKKEEVPPLVYTYVRTFKL